MKVSIIVTSCNYGQYIERCLRSLLEQNFDRQHYEVIVVDDASTDNTVELVEKYKKKYSNLRLIVNEKNIGVAASSNVGIRESFGQYVVRVDADDYVNSKFVTFLSDYLEANNGLLGVACDYIKVNDEEEVLGRFHALYDPISCGIMYRKDFLVAAGLYNDDFRHCEERELRSRLKEKNRIDCLRIPLYRYRIHGKNKTTQLAEFTNFAEKIERDYLGNGSTLKDKHVVAIIPARGGSKRLKDKNIYPVLGKPLLGWGIESCCNSKYIKDVYVTSDSEKILDVAKEYGAKSIVRPPELAEDKVFKMHAVIHAVETILNDPQEKKPDIIVVVQANSPGVMAVDLDRAIEKLFNYSKQEIFSVDNNLNQNAAFRILTREAVFQRDLSTNCGVVETRDYDIHTLEDVAVAELYLKG